MTKHISKFVICMVIISLLLSACSIFKDREVQNVETLIDEIGEVTVDSLAGIEAAEDAYDLLTDKQKEKVENYDVLKAAREEHLFIFAKSIYDRIVGAVDKISESMDIYHDAWHFGIYGDSNDDVTLEGLVDETGISYDELNYAITELSDGDSDLDYDFYDWAIEEEFSVGLWIIDEVFAYRGTFTEIEGILSSCKVDLKILEKDYPDYEYYEDLVDYYSKVNSFFGFAEEPEGTLSTFTDTVNDYEMTIESLKANLEFTFGD